MRTNGRIDMRPRVNWRPFLVGGLSALVAAVVVVTMGVASAGQSPNSNSANSQAAAYVVPETSGTTEVRRGDIREVVPAATIDATNCPSGQLPLLRITRYPTADTPGAATPAAAVSALDPNAGTLTLARMGSAQSGPYWIVAGAQTFVATSLPDGSWFASAASFIRCYDPSQRP